MKQTTYFYFLHAFVLTKFFLIKLLPQIFASGSSKPVSDRVIKVRLFLAHCIKFAAVFSHIITVYIWRHREPEMEFQRGGNLTARFVRIYTVSRNKRHPFYIVITLSDVI